MDECVFCREPFDLRKFHKKYLEDYYFYSFNFYLSKIINEIELEIDTKEYIIHKDFEIFDDNSEFLKRYYHSKESKSRMQSILKESKSKWNFPLFFHDKANEILEFRTNYIQTKRTETILDYRKSSKSRINALFIEHIDKSQKPPLTKEISTFTWTIHDIYNPSNTIQKRNFQKSQKKSKKVSSRQKSKTPMKNTKKQSLSSIRSKSVLPSKKSPKKVTKKRLSERTQPSLLNTKLSPIPTIVSPILQLKIPKFDLSKLQSPIFRKTSVGTFDKRNGKESSPPKKKKSSRNSTPNTRVTSHKNSLPVMTSRLASTNVSPFRGDIPKPVKFCCKKKLKESSKNNDYYHSKKIIYTSTNSVGANLNLSDRRHLEVKGLLKLKTVREQLSSALKSKNKEAKGENTRTKPSTTLSVTGREKKREEGR